DDRGVAEDRGLEARVELGEIRGLEPLLELRPLFFIPPRLQHRRDGLGRGRQTRAVEIGPAIELGRDPTLGIAADLSELARFRGEAETGRGNDGSHRSRHPALLERGWCSCPFNRAPRWLTSPHHAARSNWQNLAENSSSLKRDLAPSRP